MTEKELEKLFREKFEGRTYEFNPAAWEGAEKLIVEGERRKRRKAVMAWSAAASVALVAGLTSWNALTAPEAIAPNTVAWPSEDVSTEVQTMASESSESSVAVPVIEAEESTLSNASTSEVEVIETFAASTTSSDAGEVESATSSTQTITSEVVVADVATVNAMPTTTMAVVSEESTNSFATLETSELSPAELEGVSGNVNFTDALERSAASLEAKNAVADATPVMDDDEDDDVIVRPKHTDHAISYGVDAGLTASTLTGGSRGWTPSYFGGGFVNYALNSTWSLESGLTYSRRSSYGDDEQSSTVTYGFGSTRIDMNVKSTWVDYFELPLSVRYTMGDHSMEAGAYAAYKLYGVSRVTRTTESQDEGTSTETYWAQDQNDHNTTWDYGVRVGYAYRITDRWRITASGVVGMTDGFAFANSGFNQHLQFRLGARYTLGE